MKTAKAILREMIDIEDPLDEKVVISAMKKFAKEVAKEALRNAADNVELKESIPHSAIYDTIDKESILSESNIPKI